MSVDPEEREENTAGEDAERSNETETDVETQ